MKHLGTFPNENPVSIQLPGGQATLHSFDCVHSSRANHFSAVVLDSQCITDKSFERNGYLYLWKDSQLLKGNLNWRNRRAPTRLLNWEA
eukprot:scaffold2995_cov130-Cylindrotheca_fusiformis.AAC.3